MNATANNPFPAEALAEVVRRHFPSLGRAPSFDRIPTGKFNTSYWVEADGRALVLRIAPPSDSVFVFYERGMMRQEPQLHALIRSRTPVPVPEILVFDESREIIGRDYLLMERLPGSPVSESRVRNINRVLNQVGEYLAQVHALHEDRYGYLGAHRPMEPQSRWADAFAVMWEKLIADVVSAGYYSEEESRLMRRLLESRLPLFDRRVPSSLLHMDVWGQNILVDDSGAVTGIVDWDRALWGDPEIEFAVLDYCGISEPAFWEGYGQQRDRSAEAQVRNVFYLLYELQKYIVIRHGRNRNPPAARRYKEQVMEIVSRHLA